jgi:hypothetical protein
MVQPTELLEDLGVIWVTIENPSVCILGCVELGNASAIISQSFGVNIPLSVVRTRDQLGTKCPLLSAAEAD